MYAPARWTGGVRFTRHRVVLLAVLLAAQLPQKGWQTQHWQHVPLRNIPSLPGWLAGHYAMGQLSAWMLLNHHALAWRLCCAVGAHKKQKFYRS